MISMNFSPATFNHLSLSSKSSCLWTHGELVLTRKQTGCLIKLYALFGLFVEVYYSSSSMQIEKIVMLDSSAKLDFYERFIDLPTTLMV
jgi:hypothetical protein